VTVFFRRVYLKMKSVNHRDRKVFMETGIKPCKHDRPALNEFVQEGGISEMIRSGI